MQVSGSFVVSELLKEDIGEVVIYDNLARGDALHKNEQLGDARCKFF